MPIKRRGFLGSIATVLAIPKTIISEKAVGGFLPAALSGECLLPAKYSEGLVVTPEEYYNVLRKPPQSEVFTKNMPETFENLEDTSNVFGVSIYVDPAGIFIKEE